MFLFYFMRQLYSVIYDMSCGCEVMSAAALQLTPKTWHFLQTGLLQLPFSLYNL
jgi:hypothetical protein